MTDRRIWGSRGFTLVEIMIGLLMGLLAVLIMLQVFSLSESQKRATTGGADATTNAASALYVIEREVKMAGWGLDGAVYMGQAVSGTVLPTIPGCTNVNTYCDGDTTCGGSAGSITDFSLASVLIQNGASGAPDQVRARFFANPNDPNFAMQASGRITMHDYHPSDSTDPILVVNTHTGCQAGSLILVSDPRTTTNTCTLMQVSGVPGNNGAMLWLSHRSAGTHYNNPAWNTLDIIGALPSVPTGKNTGTSVATCFPHAPNGPVFERSYRVDLAKAVLLRSDNTVTPIISDETVGSGIVDLQAQYGVAADGTQNISTWVDATGAWAAPRPMAGAGGMATPGRLQNIKAVRLALLARSSSYQKPSSGAGGTCDATTGSPGTPGNADSWSTWATFNDPPGTDWRCYRYRAFEINIPLRNVIWANL